MLSSLAPAALTLALLTPGAAPSLLPDAQPTRASATIEVSDAAAGTRATVTVSRLSRTTPVVVSWGDGATTRLSTRCTEAQAARGPLARCRAVARHVFTEPGAYPVRVARGERQLAAATVEVPGASPTPTPTPTPTATPAPGDQPAAWQREMLDRVNALRAEVGAAPLALCGTLTTAATDYARVMADANHFSHTGPDGSSPGARILAAGYANATTWGENIAAGYDTVPEVMQGWRDSPGHYANIINARYTHAGFGRAENPSSTYRLYWVQNFGAGGTC